MIIAKIIFVWWTLSSVGLAMFLRFPYDLYRERPILLSMFMILAGPVYWVLCLSHWMRHGLEWTSSLIRE